MIEVTRYSENGECGWKVERDGFHVANFPVHYPQFDMEQRRNAETLRIALSKQEVKEEAA